MINCPKCQVPNPDNAAACAACGTTLVGQQFAQALDQAAAPAPAQSAPASAPAQPAAAPAPAQPAPAPAPVQPGIAPAPQMGVGGFDAPPLQTMDPNQAQAEINQFMAEQRAKKRTKSFIYVAVALVVAGVTGFFWVQNARKEKQIKEIVEFFNAFRKIDDGPGSDFWKCAVRANDRDVRLASNTAEITDGLEKAFSNYPKSQPGRIKDKCIPMITGVLAELDKLKPPEGFGGPLADFKTSMKEVQGAFEIYVTKIEARKKEAMIEQEIRNAHKDFHSVIGAGGGLASVTETPNALAYYNIMKCVIPELDKEVRKLRRPPDSQPIVDLYHKCKAEPAFAEKIRKECYEQRTATTMRDGTFKAAAHKMSGDDRDLNTLNYCFKKANHGFAQAEYKTIAEAFSKYRNQGRGNILKVMAKYKEQFAE